jgi:2-keto-4-pentenoate hydratase/2-oxohepta-3-ene-1,7-dioic acid hydratase in catechol pathway
MRLVSYTRSGAPSYGIAKSDGVFDLASRFANQPDLRSLLDSGRITEAAALEREAAPDYGWDAIEFAPVIPNPDKIICVGLNYRDHIAETGRAVSEKPVLFARFAGSQVGHRQAIIRPRVSERLDFEGELAAIIGKAGRHINEESALAHVAGYSCYNDGSIRDWQSHTSQFLPGKTFASTGGFGPWLVTSDEIPDPSGLTLQTRLNGTIVQHTSTNLMIHTIPALIAYISTILPLLPGDVLVTGTPAGVGSRRIPPLWMKPGDRVEVDISKIGVLSNPIRAEPGEFV